MKLTEKKKKGPTAPEKRRASQPTSTKLIHPWPDPPHELDCITLGKGYFKPGIRCRIIGGEEVTVYLGSITDPVKTQLPKFALKFWDEGKCAWREDRNGARVHEYGRDFKFINQ